MSTDSHDLPYARFVRGFADRFSIDPSEAHALLHSISASANPSANPSENHSADVEALDALELLLAASLNAKLRDVQDDIRFKRLKFLLRNNNARAIKLAEAWVAHNISFEDMLAAV